PADRVEMEHFARFLGCANREAFAKVLLGHLDTLQHYYARWFETQKHVDRPVLGFRVQANAHETRDRLSGLGVWAPLGASRTTPPCLGGTYRSLKSEAARAHLETLVPALLAHLSRTDHPNATLVLFDHLLANLHGPARLLPLLRQNPELISLIVLVLGTA